MSLGAFLTLWLALPLGAAPGAPAPPSAMSAMSPMRTTAASSGMRAMAAPQNADDADDVEDVEDVSEVKDVTPAQASPARKKPTFWQTLGRLHPALVHFPIAWMVLLLLVDIRTVAWGRPGWERLGLYLLVGTVLSFIPAMITGTLRMDELPHSPESLDQIAAHWHMALLSVFFLGDALILRLQRKNRLTGSSRWANLALLALSTALVLIAGHRGARLVYGSDFLPF